MSAVYVDTSALGRILLHEPDTEVIWSALAPFEERLSSQLLRVELRRLALRAGTHGADEAMEGISLLPLDQATLIAAEAIEPSSVATLDAIHLATAVRLAGDGRLDALLTFDLRLAEGARHHGLAVLSPA